MLKKLAIVLVVTCLFFTGCAIPFNPLGPIIDIGIMWVEGEAHKYYNCDKDTMYRAVRNVLNDMEYPIIEEEKAEDKDYIKAGEEDRFKIKIVKIRHNVTKLSIRINIMGDVPYAELIYRKVDQQPGVQQFQTAEELNKAVEGG